MNQWRAVETFEQKISLAGVRGELLPEYGGVEEVSHANALAVDLVGIGRPDTAPGSPDLLVALEVLACDVEGLVVGHDQVGLLADQEAVAELDAPPGHCVHFLEERGRIDDHAVSNDALLTLVQDARGDQVEDELVHAHDDRMPGVMPPLVARDDVRTLGQEVDDL